MMTPRRIPYLKSIKERLKYLRQRWHYIYTRFYSHFERGISVISVVVESLTGVAAVICLIALILYMGYNLSDNDAKTLKRILHITQIVFGLNIVYNLIFYLHDTIHQSRIIKWIVDIGIILSIMVWIVPDLERPWFPWLRDIIFSNKFWFGALGAYSIVDICYALSRIPGRRTNPSLLMASSFLIFIVIGSFMLMLPKCTYHGISYFDSIFVASSAVSITGLSTVDIYNTFTPLGLLILSILIQLGSLGIITFTSFFAMFFTGNTSIYNQLLLKDVIYSKSMNALVPTLLYVLGFTLTIELVGAVCVYISIPDTLGLDINQKLVFASFHSMSSFCNAGFSYLPEGMSNPAILNSNQLIYIVTSVLIFAGGIGFPLLVNLREIIKIHITRLLGRLRLTTPVSQPVHLFDLNTKIVLYTTFIVLILGTIGFFVFEYNNTLKDMDLYHKAVQSVFNSLAPRSAGFTSVNPAHFLDITILIVLVQMFIGGASQSMAGGIKVNTLGTVMLNLKSVLLGHSGTTAFGRTINKASVRRANAVLVVALISLLFYLIIMMLLEPTIPTKSIIFETVSALFTVGSSLGITGELNEVSKIVLSTAMLLGRVGIMSMLSVFIGATRDASDYYPTDNIIIN